MQRFLLALLCFSAAMCARAERTDTIVSLVVCDAGKDIYELEGHAALHVRIDGTDLAINWGLFDFNAPGFVWRFALGKTDYMCGAIPWPYFLDSYSRAGRRIEEYVLDLTPAEKARLIEILATNLQPANATYRYNYVKDNCATRPLRAIEAAMADSILLPDPMPEASTFREMMRAYHRNYPWYQFGIDLALGSGIDYPLSPSEKAFAPLALRQQLPEARTAGGRQIVAGTVALTDFQQGAASDGPTPWYATPMFFALTVLALATVCTLRDQKRRRLTRWFDAAMYAMFGLAGCLLVFLVFISTHEATSPNFLLMWLNPFCFIPVIFIWIKRAKRLVMWYQIANFATILLMCAAWPWLPQSANAAFWPLIAADAMRAINYISLNRR